MDFFQNTDNEKYNGLVSKRLFQRKQKHGGSKIARVVINFYQK